MAAVYAAALLALAGCSSGDSDRDPYEVQDGVFKKCDRDVSGEFVIPDGVTEIGEKAFLDCTSLESVTIPDSVTKIGDCAFSYCTSLASVNIPSSVTEIGDYAFEECTSLESVTIGSKAYVSFHGCTSLKSVIILDGVTEIRIAFSDCASLESITIPSSVKKIGVGFNNCENFKTVNYDGSSEDWEHIGGDSFFDKDKVNYVVKK